MNPIETAVAPLKNEAITRAETLAKVKIARMVATMEMAGWDLNIAAPRPNSITMNHKQYQEMLRIHNRFNMLFTTDKEKHPFCRTMSDPHYVVLDQAKVEKFIQAAKNNAAAQYEAFVAKLNHKIGTVQKAALDGDHVWGYSHLSVLTEAGEEQVWKTRMILNVSKLGLVYSQFPTRKVKAKARF